MCVGSIVIVECSGCGSEEHISAYLGCALVEHARSGWTTRESSIISRSTRNISQCDECSDFTTDSNTDSGSDTILCSFESESDCDYEIIDPSTAIYSLHYSVGRASVLTETWYIRAISSIRPFAKTMATLIDRAAALSPSHEAITLKKTIELIMIECESWQGWLESVNTRAAEAEDKLFEVLIVTGVTAEVNARNVEDMTVEMAELYHNLTTFHIHYDVKYNVGRFEGYLPVIAVRLDQLEADEFSIGAAAA